MKNAYTRQEVLMILQEYADLQGNVRLTLVEEVLRASPVSAQDMAWAYRKARALGLLPAAMAVDPRTNQLLAMDT